MSTFARLPFSAFRGFVPCWNCAPLGYNLPCVAFFFRPAWVSPSCVLFSPLWAFLPFICSVPLRWQSSGGFRPSGVMILSRLARLPSVSALFRLFGLPVVVCYPLRLSVRSRAFFGFVSAVRIYLSSYNRRRASVNLSHNACFCPISLFCCCCGVVCPKMVTNCFWGAFWRSVKVLENLPPRFERGKEKTFS